MLRGLALWGCAALISAVASSSWDCSSTEDATCQPIPESVSGASMLQTRTFSTEISFMLTGVAREAMDRAAAAARANGHKVSVQASRLPSDAEKSEFVSATNIYRCRHGAAHVEWSDSLASQASTYIQDKTSLVHSRMANTGENLYWSSGTAEPAKAVDAWYSEVDLCTGGPEAFTNGCYQRGTGHFTALVWSSTSPMRMGCAFNADGRIIICQYQVHDSPSLENVNMNGRYGNYVHHVFPRTNTATQCGGTTPAPLPASSTTPAPLPASSSCVGESGCVLSSSCAGAVTFKFHCGTAFQMTVTMPGTFSWDLSNYCSMGCNDVEVVSVAQ